MNLQAKNKGSASIFLCFLMVPLFGLMALSVDYGFLLYTRADLQRAADQAVLAAVRDLLPRDNGTQDIAKTKQTVHQYVASNMGEGFEVLDSDIEIGRYDPDKIYSSVEILSSGTFDTVRVTVRNDSFANQSISLYFARLFGKNDANVSAVSTAILQRARYLEPGVGVFPFAMEQKAWDKVDQGDTARIYGDGGLEDENGQKIPGNWGTVDIGPQSNSTADLKEQILNGLSQNDLLSLHQQGATPEPDRIDSQQNPLNLNGDTGLSAGIKDAVEQVEGTKKLVPIYKKSTGHGGNLNFEVVGWGVVEVVDSYFQGNNNTYIEVRKSTMYSKNMTANSDLSDLSQSIEGAFTSPVLVQ